jgi:hypothetical protein
MNGLRGDLASQCPGTLGHFFATSRLDKITFGIAYYYVCLSI